MAKDKATATANLWQVMLQRDVYKRTQGKVARQITFGALFVLVIMSAWQLAAASWMENLIFPGGHYALGGLLAVVGGWAAYRAVNYAAFADFLIAVEAEMNKVSWPAVPELVKASGVVIFVIFFLAAALFMFDLVWQALFGFLRNI